MTEVKAKPFFTTREEAVAFVERLKANKKRMQERADIILDEIAAKRKVEKTALV